MKTLIVEDDAFFRSVIEDAIASSRMECDVLVAATGQSALALLEEHGQRVGVALVDLGLPDMNGLEVIGAIHEQYPDIRILVISSSAEESRLFSAVRLGAVGYIVKGDAHISISRALEQLMDGLHPISPQLAGYLLKRVDKQTPTATAEVAVDRLELSPLTARERELLVQFAEGASYAKAADNMNISVATAQTHARNLYRKLGVHSGLQALSKARAHGLL